MLYLRLIMPQLTSLDVPIPWNIRADSNGNYDVNEGINFYISPAQTKQSLFTRIETTLSVNVPASYNKYSLTLISLFGIRNPPEVLPFKNLQVICREVYKLRLLIAFLYEIYGNLLVGSNETLPDIPGFRGPNFDRAVISHLLDTEQLTNEDTVLYSYAIFAYFYWAVLNGYGSRLNHRFIKDRMAVIENTPFTAPDAPIDNRSEQNVLPATPEPTNLRRQRSQITSRRRAGSVDLKHLKEKFLDSYQKLIDAGINKAEDCVICLESMNHNKHNQKEMVVLECGHLFHLGCLTSWRKQICPTCRAPHYCRSSTSSRNGVLPIREIVDLIPSHNRREELTQRRQRRNVETTTDTRIQPVRTFMQYIPTPYALDD